jgi:hypothetical protein
VNIFAWFSVPLIAVLGFLVLNQPRVKSKLLVWLDTIRRRIRQNSLIDVDDAESIVKMKAVLRSCWQPVRIVISYTQVVAQLGNVLDLRFDVFEQIVRFLAKLNLMDGLLFSECAGLDAYLLRWVFAVVITPCSLVAVCLAIYFIELLKQNGKESSADAWKDLSAHLFFVVFFCCKSPLYLFRAVLRCVSLRLNAF